MSKFNHTAGKIHTGAGNGEDCLFADGDGLRMRMTAGGTALSPIASFKMGWSDEEDAANGERLAASWNAFDGVATEAILELGTRLPGILAGATAAQLFMTELLDSVETLCGIADEHGSRTLADLMYLHQAILEGGFIDLYPDQSMVLELVRALPSSHQWVSHIKVAYLASSPDDQETKDGLPCALCKFPEASVTAPLCEQCLPHCVKVDETGGGHRVTLSVDVVRHPEPFKDDAAILDWVRACLNCNVAHVEATVNLARSGDDSQAVAGVLTNVRKSVIQFTVLHDDGKDLAGVGLSTIAHECGDGGYVGGNLIVLSSSQLTTEQVAKEARELGSDETFFADDSSDEGIQDVVDDILERGNKFGFKPDEDMVREAVEESAILLNIELSEQQIILACEMVMQGKASA